MTKEVDPKEPIQFAWNAFVDAMAGKMWGTTDAFKWAWEEARKQEREACAKACEEVIFKVKPIYCVVAENCVKVIRARGQE
jgi:hypothetical protein